MVAWFLGVSISGVVDFSRFVNTCLRYSTWNKVVRGILGGRILGIERSTLDRKIRRYGLIPDVDPVR